MNSLVKVTIRVSLVLGFNLSNVGLAFAFDEACLPKYQLHANISSSSSVFFPLPNNTKEDEPYDPGDVGNPEGGSGAGSR